MTSTTSRRAAIFFLGAAIASALSSLAARSIRAADDPKGPDAAAFGALAEEVTVRMEAARALNERRADALARLDRLRTAPREAEQVAALTRAVASDADAAHRKDEATLNGEIVLAEAELNRAKDRFQWSEDMHKRGAVAANVVLADKMNRQKAEISLDNAKLKQKVLRDYTERKRRAEAEEDVKNADARITRAKADLSRAEAEVADLDRRVADAAWNEAERGAILRLDEAWTLSQAGQAEPSRAKLDEARRLWDEAKSTREKARLAALKAGIHREAERLRSGQPGR